MRTIIPLVVLFIPCWLSAQDKPSNLVPVPSTDDQKKAEKLVKDLFKDEYAKKAPADQQTLAKKLLQQGIDTKGDPAVQFILLREARELAAKSGDVATLLKAADETAKIYDVDVLALKSQAITAAAGSARTPESATALAEACIETADAAVAADKYEAAKGLLTKAETAAKAAKDVGLVVRVQQKSKEIEAFLRESQKTKDASKLLDANPDDAGANLLLGRYNLMKGDDEKALPMLAKGSDVRLKAAAEKELAKPSTPEEQAKLAEAWWDAGENEKVPAIKSSLWDLARNNYEKALSSLTGIEKTKAEKRLITIEDTIPGPINLLRMIDPKLDAIKGTWTFKNGLLYCGNMLQIPYQPPEEYNYRVVIRRAGSTDFAYFHLATPSGRAVLSVDGMPHLGWQTYMSVNQPPPGLKGKQYLKGGINNVVEFEVRNTSIKISINDEKIFDWTGKLSQAKPSDDPKLDPKALVIGSWDGGFAFVEIKIFPLSGRGKRLR